METLTYNYGETPHEVIRERFEEIQSREFRSDWPAGFQSVRSGLSMTY